MNQVRTARAKMSFTKILLAAAVSLVILTSAASAQESLGDLMEQTGCNWLIGNWAGQSDDGQKYEIEYKWEIKPYIMSIHFKGFDFEYHGIIFYKASDEEVVQIGVDNNGGSGKGTWTANYGKAVMKSEHTGEYGEISRMGFVYSKIDSQTMKMELHDLDQYGWLSDNPNDTLEYKRQKAKKKAATRK
jgi:hypothetical protein